MSKGRICVGNNMDIVFIVLGNNNINFYNNAADYYCPVSLRNVAIPFSVAPSVISVQEHNRRDFLLLSPTHGESSTRPSLPFPCTACDL